ncbi:hypothetical protein ACHAXT_002812 [Thalassiosira profunda]
MNNRRSSRRAVFLVLVIACILLGAASFVVQPQRTVRRRVRLPSTLQSYEPEPEQKPSSFLGDVANKVTSWLPFKQQPKDELTRKGEKERRMQQKEMSRGMKEALRPFPWPVRAVGNSLTNTVTRTFGKEARKAEVLLADARRLIEADSDARDALGEPIITGRLFSQSTSGMYINFIGGKRIQISFEVIGSRNRGVASLVAYGYANGHITSLQVCVQGITYDIV